MVGSPKQKGISTMAVIKSLEECGYCKRKVYHLVAKGLCSACYNRDRRNGTPGYQDRSRKPCSIEDCQELSVAQGLCEKHYRRLKRRGVVNSERYEKWGHGTDHPLYDTWRWVKKRAARQGICDEWNDFWAFVRDVGERPSGKHRFMRLHKDRPYGADNFEWRPPVTDIPVEQKVSNATYMRAYRLAQPRIFQAIEMKVKYGITIEQYDEMRKAQDGLCAICSQEEKSAHRNGTVRQLSIDHCHTTGNVRGLLCGNCNNGLGHFKDNPASLERAITYLRKHEKNEAA